MNKILSILLAAIAVAAAIFFAVLFWHLVTLILAAPVAGPLHYSGKQVDGLAEIAKVLIPTVTGFAVLAASGAGYLQTHAFARFQKQRIGIYLVFVCVVVSLACWIMLLGATVDCSRPFEATEALKAELNLDVTGLLNHTYSAAVTLAKLGSVSFFIGIDIALLVAIWALSEPPAKNIGTES